MVVVAESGATKTDWYFGDCHVRTRGINPAVMPESEIFRIVREAVGNSVHGSAADIAEVHFYAAGVVGAGTEESVRSVLETCFPHAEIECATDLLAASRALWGNSPGLVAILGTGSNSCIYDGVQVVRNIRPGGYILGDEGSGSSLGKLFLADYVKGILPAGLATRFREESGLDYAAIVENVYRSAAPSAFLASVAPFVVECAENEPYAAELVESNFRSFIERCLLNYGEAGGLSVGVVGSFGCACRKFLVSLGGEYGLDFCRFEASPARILREYHRNF